MGKLIKFATLLNRILPPVDDPPADMAVQRALLRAWQAADADQPSDPPGPPPGHPMLFQSGRVVVFTASAAAASSLRHSSAARLRQLQAHGLPATSLHITRQPPQPRPPAVPHRRIHLDPKVAANIAATARTLDNSALRDALLRLASRARK